MTHGGQRPSIAELEILLQAALEEIVALVKNSTKTPPNRRLPILSNRPNTPKDKRKRKQKIGAQKEHKQHLRKPFDKSQVDHIIELQLEACPKCGGNLVSTTEPPKIHQHVELVDKPFSVTEFQQSWYWCDHCQCFHAAKL